MNASPPDPSIPPKPPASQHAIVDEAGVIRTIGQVIRARILSGLLAALPLALTIFIVHYLYLMALTLLTPLVTLIRYVLGNYGINERVWTLYVAPLIAVALVLSVLYSLGLFVRTRYVQAINWVFMQVPVVNTIFKAISEVVQSFGQQLQGNTGFKRVVLVEFPSPGMKSLAFVTNTLRDAATERVILCVTVLTGVMPPSGFTLFVPEEKVTDIDWSMNQTLQAILSGGINAPGRIHYFDGVRVPSTGPILGPQGVPIVAATDDDGLAGSKHEENA